MLTTIDTHGLPVIGLPNDYFVFMHTEFYNLCYVDTHTFKQKVKQAVMIMHDFSELDKYYAGLPCDNLNNINKNYHQQKITTVKYMNQPIRIYKITRKDQR